MCSMYGIFTNIYLINDPNVVNIPYMEHMGIDYPHAFLQGFAGVDACARAALTAGVDQEKCHVTDPMETLPWDLWDDYNGTIIGL